MDYTINIGSTNPQHIFKMTIFISQNTNNNLQEDVNLNKSNHDRYCGSGIYKRNYSDCLKTLYRLN